MLLTKVEMSAPKYSILVSLFQSMIIDGVGFIFGFDENKETVDGYPCASYMNKSI